MVFSEIHCNNWYCKLTFAKDACLFDDALVKHGKYFLAKRCINDERKRETEKRKEKHE